MLALNQGVPMLRISLLAAALLASTAAHAADVDWNKQAGVRHRPGPSIIHPEWHPGMGSDDTEGGFDAFSAAWEGPATTRAEATSTKLSKPKPERNRSASGPPFHDGDGAATA